MTRGKLHLIGLLAVLCAGLLLPSTALAVEPTLAVLGANSTTRHVLLKATHEAGISSIVFMRDGTAVATLTPSPGASATQFLMPVPEGQGTATFLAKTRIASGLFEVDATSTPSVSFSSAPYLPKAFSIRPPNGGVLNSGTLWVSGKVSTGTRNISLSVNGAEAGSWDYAHGWTGYFSLPGQPVRYGRNSFTVRLSNAWGTVVVSPRAFWYLGAVPAASSFILVDRSEYRLYLVKGRVMSRTYPVAIGLPSTPTPVGMYRLGEKQYMSATGPWGVLRLHLYRKTSYGYVSTRYYIHGTNDPESIGTQASLGCVRLYNKDVLALSRLVWRGLTVQIRQ